MHYGNEANNSVLRFEAKRIRAEVIAQHLRGANMPARCVCFTCGNSARALREAGVFTIEVGSNGMVQPTQWMTPTEIAAMWPFTFDATSGHLPLWMMQRIGQAFAAELGPLPGELTIPSGSGETVVCLAMAYPGTRFTAAYDNTQAPTTFNSGAPLNELVELLAHRTIQHP